MKTRPIDANQLYRIEKLLDTDIVKKDKVASELLEQVLYDIQHMPTLTQPNEWVRVEDEIPSDDDDGLEFFCMTNATGKGGGVLPLEWEVATIRGKTVRRWRWLNRISPWTVTHWMKRPAPPTKEG
jgi:hypothetical protein